MTWALALLDVEFQIADAQRDRDLLKRRICRLQGAAKTIKECVATNVPWPGDEVKE